MVTIVIKVKNKDDLDYRRILGKETHFWFHRENKIISKEYMGRIIKLDDETISFSMPDKTIIRFQKKDIYKISEHKKDGFFKSCKRKPIYINKAILKEKLKMVENLKTGLDYLWLVFITAWVVLIVVLVTNPSSFINYLIKIHVSNFYSTLIAFAIVVGILGSCYSIYLANLVYYYMRDQVDDTVKELGTLELGL